MITLIFGLLIQSSCNAILSEVTTALLRIPSQQHAGKGFGEDVGILTTSKCPKVTPAITTYHQLHGRLVKSMQLYSADSDLRYHSRRSPSKPLCRANQFQLSCTLSAPRRGEGGNTVLELGIFQLPTFFGISMPANERLTVIAYNSWSRLLLFLNLCDIPVDANYSLSQTTRH